MEHMRHIVKSTSSFGTSPALHIVSPDARIAAGKALRDQIPREQHGRWNGVKGRPNPIDLLHKSDAGRMKNLLAIRYGRMLPSPSPTTVEPPGSWPPTWHERRPLD